MNQQPKHPADPSGRPKRPEGGSGSSATRRALGTVGRLLAALFMLCIITGCIVVCVLTVYILRYMGSDTDITLDSIQLNYTTILYAPDKGADTYHELQRIYGGENRIWVNYDQMPKYLTNAAIAGEDERFLTHHGVDWKRTAGAALGMFIPLPTSGQGGSTITQQLIKNTTGDNAVRVDRKVREIFRALNLEKHATKEQILEAYLNTLSLGNNTNGVQAAANLYFDKDVKDLSVAESAALIAITKYPVYYDPFTNPDNNKTRRNWIINKMYELNMISQDERDEAISTELVFSTKEAASTKLNANYSWFVDNVIEEVIQDLMTEKNYTYKYAQQLLFKGGYRVYTTVDEDIQNYLQSKYEDDATFPQIKNKVYPQSAFVITDLHGKVLAMVGAKGPKTANRDFNRATMAVRQPGSTIKPIASYPVAFENDLITWSTVFNDKPIMKKDANSTKFDWPIDHYGAYLTYPVTVDEAIRRSTNTIPAQLVQMMGPDMVFNFMVNKLHVETLVDKRVSNGRTLTDRTIASMSIGALTDGVTPVEMAGAYQYIGNGGTYTKPYSYTYVLDAQGNVVLEKDTTPERVVSSETATIINRLLQRVTTAQYGTGTASHFRSDIPVAGKTGTTDADVDQWFVGITPYYLGVCWLGYDTPATIGYYKYPPPIIWKNIMTGLHKDLPGKDFEYSSKVVSRTYCTITGLLASDSCEHTATGWYNVSNIPDVCTYCSGEHTIDELNLYYKSTPEDGDNTNNDVVDLENSSGGEENSDAGDAEQSQGDGNGN